MGTAKTAYLIHKKRALLKAKMYDKEESEEEDSDEPPLHPVLMVRPSNQVSTDSSKTTTSCAQSEHPVVKSQSYVPPLVKKLKGRGAIGGTFASGLEKARGHRVGSRFMFSDRKAASGQRGVTKLNVPSPRKHEQHKVLFRSDLRV